MSAVNRALTVLENVLAAGALAAAALIAFLAIVLRAAFGIFLFWAEEAIIYLVILSTFVGAVITLRHQEHVNVDLVAVFLGRRGKQVMALVALVVTVVYLGIIGYFGWLLLFEPFSSSTSTPSMDLPLWVVELSLPIGFTLMFIRAIQLIVRTIRQGAHEEDVMQTEASALGLDADNVNRVRDDLARGADEKGRSDS